MNYHRYVYVLIVSVILVGITFGQSRTQTPQVGIVFFETLTLPSPNDNTIRLDINYRVMKNFFILTRTSDPGSEYQYQGEYQLNIEIFNTDGISKGREIIRSKIFSDKPQLEFPDIEYIQGGVTFNLPEDEYRFLIQLQDQNSQRRHVDRDRRLSLIQYDTTQSEIYEIVFIDPVYELNDTAAFQPVNLGGNLFFGNDAHAVLLFSLEEQTDTTPEITVSIRRFQRDERRPGEEKFTTQIPDEYIFPGTIFDADHSENELRYKQVDSDNPNLYTALFETNNITLDEGMYRINITIDNDGKTIEKNKIFQVQWVDKPASLRNFDFAMEMLEYIMESDEYRQIRRGSSDERQEKFRAYWKSKDPEPETAFNPVMTEFYRRVDYAAREFTTIRERNGARTDRGKIHILYGPPTERERSLTPGQIPQETWKYSHLNKKFIFTDQSRQGNYQLVAREDI